MRTRILALPRAAADHAAALTTPASRRLLWHVVVPAVVGAVLAALFFSGSPTLATIVAPPWNRELGLLEHLQVVLLAAVAWWATRAARAATAPRMRWALRVVAIGSIGVLLEELNYGQHYLALLLGRGSEGEIGPVSVHNVGDLTDWIKLAGDAVLFVFFAALPLVAWLSGRRPLRGATPSGWYAATLGVMLLLNQLVHRAGAWGVDPGWMQQNRSEFRELLIYYIVALYAREWLTCVAGWRPAARPSRPSGTRGAGASPSSAARPSDCAP